MRSARRSALQTRGGWLALGWVAWTLGTGLAASAAPQPASAARPNILFILCDDLGYGDVGVFFQNARRQQGKGPWHATPQIDRLAASGVRLTDHYCPAPVCAPSRASLLLGQHQGHASVRDNQFDKALEDQPTLGSVLQAAGYTTVCIGKWGLQGEANPAPPAWPAHPLNRGFDEYYGYIRHRDGHEHYPKEGPYRQPKEVWDNRTEVSTNLDKCYTTDLFTARAKHYLSEHQRTNAAQPFFLFLSYDTPHAVLEYPTQAYPAGGGVRGGLQWLGQPGRMINTASGTIDSWCHPDYAGATWDPGTNAGPVQVPWPEVYKRYATCVRRIDDAVGDLLQHLAELGIERETLVVFTTDNGPSRESYLKADYEPTFFHSFGPFDGIKRDCWEGGIRVGAWARWPGRIPAGRVSDVPCGFWDWMPTFAQWAGVPPPARTDGRSLVPTLAGEGVQRPPTVYVEYFEGGKTPAYPEFAANKRNRARGQMQAIRLGDFMGVRYQATHATNDFEIFQLPVDPQQTNNLAPFLPDLQQRMKERVLQVRRPGGGVTRPYDDEPAAPVRAGWLRQGRLDGAFYAGSWPWLPDFATLVPQWTGAVRRLSAGAWDESAPFGLRFRGYFQAPRTGRYTFYLSSDAGAQLRLHEALVVDDGCRHAAPETSGTIVLRAGWHPLRVEYRHESGPAVLRLEYRGPGIERRPVPASALASDR